MNVQMNPKNPPMIFVVSVFFAPLLSLGAWWGYTAQLPQNEQGIAQMLLASVGLGVSMLLIPVVMAAVYMRFQPPYMRSAAVFLQACTVLLVIHGTIVMGGCGLGCALVSAGGG